MLQLKNVFSVSLVVLSLIFYEFTMANFGALSRVNENLILRLDTIRYLKRYELYIAQKRNATVEKYNFRIFGCFKSNILSIYNGQLWSIIEG